MEGGHLQIRGREENKSLLQRSVFIKNSGALLHSTWVISFCLNRKCKSVEASELHRTLGQASTRRRVLCNSEACLLRLYTIRLVKEMIVSILFLLGSPYGSPTQHGWVSKTVLTLVVLGWMDVLRIQWIQEHILFGPRKSCRCVGCRLDEISQ